MRARALRALFEEHGAARCKRFRNGFFGKAKYLCGRRLILSFQQDIFAPEFTVRIAARRGIPDLFDSVMAAENGRLIRAEGIRNLLSAPDVKRAFRVLWPVVLQQAVGVFSGEKAAFRVRHVS